MRDLDLTTLRLLLAVAEHGNIARAAEQSHTAPSAVSKRIAQLESQFGVPLLVRGRRGVAPTPAGTALVERVRTVLFEMGRIDSEMAAFGSGVGGVVRVLATPSAMAEALPDDIAAFMRDPANGGIKVDIEERFTRDVSRLLREGSSAIGVCWDSADLRGLEQRPYRHDDLALAAPRGHALAGRRSLRFVDTLDHDQVSLQPSSAVQLTLQRAAAREQRSANYRFVVSNFDAALRVVAAGLAVGIIPMQVASPLVERGDVVFVPLRDAWAHRRFVVCWRDAAALQPASRRMVEHLAAQAQEGGQVGSARRAVARLPRVVEGAAPVSRAASAPGPSPARGRTPSGT